MTRGRPAASDRTVKGAKRKGPRCAHHGTGWLMICTPSGRVVSVVEQRGHENNAVVRESLVEVLGH
eukprot:6264961-Pyramimonas_sp.AAC.1